jgi:hypothetical protein
MRKAAFKYALVAICAAFSLSANAAEQVGAASSLRPAAQQSAPSAAKSTVVLDAPIYRDATLETSKDGLLEVTFLDKSKLALGGESTVIIDEFVYAGPAAPAGQVLKFTKGVFRFISGAMPKDSVKIETPTSLIGIRGTTLRIRVEADGTTTVGCDEGLVFVTSRQTGQTVNLDPGEKVTIKPSGEISGVVIGRVEGCPG